jgi:1,4-dihydroxy-2-naphthoyl-CoA synthase
MAEHLKNKYTDILVDVAGNGQIGIIKFNRPSSLNAFGGNLMADTVAALREFNEHPTTIFTVLTGEGRFFSAGADVKAESGRNATNFANPAEKKLAFLSRFATGEWVRGKRCFCVVILQSCSSKVMPLPVVYYCLACFPIVFAPLTNQSEPWKCSAR